MKKFLFLFCVLFLTGCGFITNEPCEHEYTETTIPSTCINEGVITKICSKCFDVQLSTIPKKEHDYDIVVIEPTCIDDGYTLKTCKNCKKEDKVDIKSKLNHDYTEWEILITPTEFNDGFKKRICLRCNEVEEQIIASVNYIELDVFRIDYQEDKQYIVNTYEELLVLFDAVILNRVELLICELKFENNDTTALIKKLMNDSSVSAVYTVTPSFGNNILKLTISYNDFAINVTPGVNYIQYASGNTIEAKSSREDSFDNFAINNVMYQYEVSNSEQLFYVLERNVKPICKEGSSAELIYKEIKKVLVEIIDDNMTDLEKVRAIHDWLVMNITYDGQLLDIIMNGQDARGYRSFNLEGVFIDKKAVCEGIAKAFACMANIEGIPCVYVEGYQTNNPDGLGHAWNKVYVNGKWYIIDVTSDGIVINDQFEVLSYKSFLIDEETMNKKYMPKYTQMINCSNSFNSYNTFKFNYENKEYDYEIESIDELVTIIKYFGSLNYEHKSVEFKLVLNYGDSVVDELKEAINKANIEDQITFTQDNNIIALIK